MISSAWIILSPSVVASPIQYDYSGVITSAPASSGAVTGTPFSGSIWYDPSGGHITATEGWYGYSPDFGMPHYSLASTGITLRIGGQDRINDPGQLLINVQYTPMYGPSDPTPPSSKVIITDGTQAPYPVELTLTNPSMMIRPSLTVPGTISLSDFTTAQLDYIQKTASGNLEFQGSITAMAAVPESASAMIFCLAAGWLMSQQCRRRRRTMSLTNQK